MSRFLRPNRRRASLQAPESIAGVIGRAEPRDPRAKPNVPQREWEIVVGPRIAERAQPVEIDRGVLVVRVATSVWGTELSLLSTAIVERLRGRGFDVQSLRCRVGVIDAPVRAKALRETRTVPAPAPLPSGLEEAIANVDDEELRAVIASAARANLAWQAYVSPAERPPHAETRERSTNEASRAARVPLSVGTESDRPVRTTAAASARPPRKL